MVTRAAAEAAAADIGALRRHLARQVVAILTAADALQGAERTALVQEKLEALQQDVLARRQA